MNRYDDAKQALAEMADTLQIKVDSRQGKAIDLALEALENMKTEEYLLREKIKRYIKETEDKL